MTDSLAANSDQLNAVDLAVPRTFTIESVTRGSADQPFNFHLAELPGMPWRPSKGMRRVITHGWGPKVGTYAGRRVTLWCNPEVKWAGAPVGGIQVSHMSNIGQPFTMPLRISQKQTVQYRVDPLPDVAPTTPDPSPDEIAACTDVDTLKAWWQTSSPATRELINARGAALKANPTP